jgi:lipoprotein-anchoring transpeptidase ErfK/SrfK
MPLSRRTFLKLGGSLLLAGPLARTTGDPPEWVPGVRLGRMTESRIRLYNRPHPEGRDVAFKYRDDVVTIVREVVGLGFYPHNHVWFETTDGYAYSSWVQPVKYAPAAPAAPAEGVYGEVCVPYTDARHAPDSQSPTLYRLYYPTTYQLAGRVVAADDSLWYRLHDENVVTMYAQAEHIRIVDPDEFAPLSPGIADKSIVVSLGDQRLTALEGAREVFRATIASGRNFFGPDGTTAGSLTPAGEHPLWQKRASRHMTGGTPTDGYDLPGVPWVSYFSGNGAALHGTYWHNDYGTPKSAGCINLRPEDAKWLFRWTLPEVPYVPGHITVEWPGGTRVVIRD